jgi:uncharacterized protein (DUF305 family)
MTLKFACATLGSAMLVALALPATGADTDAGRTLPDACKAPTTTAAPMDHMHAGGADMGGMDMGGNGAAGVDQAHQDLMQGMDAMNANMNEGMLVSDIDAAFICSMIPHHQGALDMAKAELAHGTDPWVKARAQTSLDSQAAALADLIGWRKTPPQ